MKQLFFRKKVSTFSKVIALLSSVTIGLLLLVLSLYFYTRYQEKQIFKSSKELYTNEINSLLKLNSESYASVISDVTYWDEFVDFTKSKNLKWFNTSVANILDAYKVEYLCAYSVDGEFITKVSSNKIQTKEFIPKEVFSKLYEKRFDRFFLKTPEGIVDVYAATIHPSDDPFKNKAKPSGYFFMVRLLDSDYFNNIEEICSSKIKFYTGKETAEKTVFTTVPLLDYKGDEVSTLYFKRAYDIDFSITKRILLITALALILSCLIYFYYANKWSRLPISFIKKILVSQDESAINSLKNIKGEFRYIGKLFEDNKKKTEELAIAKNKAEESDKLKSAFLMNLSHEIRTPMNAVIGFSDLLSNTKLSETEQKEYIKIIQQSGKSLIAIIDDLVEMSKIDSQLIKPNLSSVNLNQLVQEVYDSYKIIQKPKVTFKYIGPEQPIKANVVTDSTKLREILINLIDNAFKFTDEGYILLEYWVNEEAKKIEFQIKDSGIGIEEKFQKKIFQRFSKLNFKGNSANEGLGLGLAISKAYLEMLGGEISFQSQFGVGTVFTFAIPLEYDSAKSVANSEPKAAVVISDLGNEKLILVAEDDNINFILIERILKMIGFNVLRAKDGVEAVQFFKENSEIDLIFMDIKMPNMDGYEAFEAIRKFNLTIPIIAHTSYSFPEEIQKIKDIGFTDYISKPLNKEAVVSMVNKYFA